MAEKSVAERIDDAIDRLTDISSELSRIVAVHEQRLGAQERHVDDLEEIMEKRREETDVKLKDVYETIRSEDKNILNELYSLRKEASEQHQKLTNRIEEMERTIWMYMGGFSVVIFLITYGHTIFSTLIK